MPGASDTQRGNEGLQAGFEPSAAERRKGGSALEDHHVRGTVSETGLQIVTELMGRRRTARAMAGIGNGIVRQDPCRRPHARTLHRPA
ncbi:hypothetical protein XAP3CFBP6996_013305 [Xanthomonas citri pv. fuscans CFBP 6996]|uniref:Uncharacterized protein n=2 Tax=Xanthomonas citri TaxID=346 RepID=A0AB33CLB9_XANCI|nr:hypothetical protein XcvCFBP7111P_05220 [Xanthomonas citri pv. vignicola]PTY30260.1 hypothetical protein XAP3CFBP6996_013305 [Xanthomonas citri pv. fuscans CFBP 6996]QWN04863.1 hypothetical protein DGN16_18675 [Xanthomonas citri pv. fuscans]QWN17606.1 hypothetical protein DGN02_18785 [Xanthomonas citri]RTE57552.1 hypothetical protein EI541_12475 [Xanthomonas axonopodis pv. eucalyptorum]